MSLPSADTLKSELLALPPTENKMEGIANLVAVIAKHMNKVQGGPTGKAGIFTLNEPVMIGILSALVPVPDDSWITTFATAYQAASMAAIVSPATVSNPAWVGSGSKDILTLPIGAASIPTIAVAKTLLQAALQSAKPDDEAPKPIADGIHDATLAFLFLCIGLGPPPVFPPIPIPTPAK